METPWVRPTEPLPPVDPTPLRHREIADATIDDCEWSVVEFQSALPRARGPLKRRVDDLFVDAVVKRLALEDRMEKRWSSMDRISESHPDYEQREDMLIADIKEYEQWTNVMRKMASMLGRVLDQP
jgi:hypothetical protein